MKDELGQMLLKVFNPRNIKKIADEYKDEEEINYLNKPLKVRDVKKVANDE